MKKLFVVIIVSIILLSINSINTYAKSKEEMQEEIDAFVYATSSKGLNKQTLGEIIENYKKWSEEFTNDELAEMITKTKADLIADDVEKEHIENIENFTKLLKNFETQDLRNIIESIDLEKALDDISEGASILDLVKSAANNMPTEKKAGLFAKIALSSKIVRNVLTVLVSLGIYKILLRCIIYKKAGKHAWTALIPICKEIVMLKICGMSLWWILLLFVPIIGWFILWLVYIASRFMLAEAFGKGELFGLGLLILGPLFETYIVLSRKTKYIGFEEEEIEEVTENE